jgi:hypothetical protein
LAIGYWLLAIGYWLFAMRRQSPLRNAEIAANAGNAGNAIPITFHFSPLTFHPLLFASLRLCVRFASSGPADEPFAIREALLT